MVTLSFGYDGHSPSSLPTSPTAGPGNPTLMRGTGHAFNADNQDAGNAYDGDGNPTSYGGNALTFDAEDRMTAFGSALTNGYDGDDGLRAWKQNSSGTRTYFLYDGDDPVCELSRTGAVTAVNTVGANGIVSRHTSAGSVFYAFDPSGEAAQRLDPNGNILTYATFTAYGSRNGVPGDVSLTRGLLSTGRSGRSVGLPIDVLGEKLLADGQGWRFAFAPAKEQRGLTAPIALTFRGTKCRRNAQPALLPEEGVYCPDPIPVAPEH